MYKISLFLIAAFLSIGFYACKKSANVAPKPPSLLVGKWIKNFTVDTTITAGYQYIDTTGVPSSPQIYYQFNNDGTGLWGYSSTIEEKFSYKTANSTLYLFNATAPVFGTTDQFSYAPPSTESILKLNTTELILSERDTVIDSSHTEIDAYSVHFSKAQ